VYSKGGFIKNKTALEYSTRVVQKGGGEGPSCKKSTLNDLVHLTPLRIPLINPPQIYNCTAIWVWDNRGKERGEKIC
jgi:hypothetical protein